MYKKKKFILIGGGLILFSIIVFSPTFFNGKYFGWYNDMCFQDNVFLEEWFRIIKECQKTHTLAIYSWNVFPGTDFFVSNLFYTVGDFILTPYFFFADSVDINLCVAVETCILLVLSGLFFQLYLDSIHINNEQLSITLSIIYAVSGYIMMFTGSYMFHRFYALLPLLFLFTEKYIQYGKKTGFIITISILFMQNFEQLYATSLFLILYFIVSCCLKGIKGIGNILKKAFPLIFAWFIGIAICGFALIPLFIFLSGNSRIATMDYGSILWDYRAMTGFIFNLIVPSFNFRTGIPDFLFASNGHFGTEYGTFTTVFYLLAFITLLKRGENQDKKVIMIGELVLLVFILVRPLNMVVHAFSVPTMRWTFLLVFYHLFVSAYVSNKYDYKRNKKECMILVIILLAILMAFAILQREITIWSYVILIIGIIAILIYDFLYSKWKKLTYVLMILNVGIFYVLSIYPSWSKMPENRNALNKNVLQYIRDIDDEKLFRMQFMTDEIRPFNELNLNTSQLYNYPSVTAYTSTYDSRIAPFLSRVGIENWIIDIKNPELLKMLGVRYIGVYKDKSILAELETEYVTNNNEFSIYKVNNAYTIGHTYSKFIEASTEKTPENWNEELAIQKEDLELVKNIRMSNKAFLHIKEYSGQYFKGIIQVPEKTVLFISIPYSKGWHYYNQDGNSLQQINVQYGFTGLIIDEKTSEIVAYYQTPGLKIGIIISVIGIFLLFLNVLFEKKLN